MKPKKFNAYLPINFTQFLHFLRIFEVFFLLILLLLSLHFSLNCKDFIRAKYIDLLSNSNKYEYTTNEFGHVAKSFLTDNEQTDDLNKNLEDAINELDDESLNGLLDGLGSDEVNIFGTTNFKDKLKQIISGEDVADYNSLFSYLIAVFFGNISQILPFILLILGICAVFSVINSLKSGFASDQIGNIIKFACVCTVSLLLFNQIFSLISSVSKMVESINTQINVIFPVILTLMTATGSSGAVAVYSPAVAILGQLLTKVITILALPCFIVSIVFDIVGNISDTVKLKKLSGFFFSALKWVLSTAFFVFLAFMSVRGITASIKDGVSIRTAKFAISNYVPIIGGYLSEGFNLVMASSVLIKNAVGLSGMVLLLLTIAPIIIKIMVFSLSLSLLGAVVEPLGLDSVSSIMSGMGKSLKSLTAIILGLAFIYFVFLLLVICTGNLII